MNETPARIQRRRTKGFRLDHANPNGLPIKCVTRPGPFGNPWTVKTCRDTGLFEVGHETGVCRDEFAAWLRKGDPKEDRPEYRHLQSRWTELMRRLPELRGCNLACFCPLSAPCHADVLLREANK